MLNSIKSIDPRFEPDNLPPYPKSKTYFSGGKNINENKDKQILWKKLKELKDKNQKI